MRKAPLPAILKRVYKLDVTIGLISLFAALSILFLWLREQSLSFSQFSSHLPGVAKNQQFRLR